MSAWYELNAWNVTDAAAEWTNRLNADIANKLDNLVTTAKTQAAKQFLTAADNLAMANAWTNVTAALSSELTLAQQTAGNATIAQKLANAQFALDNVDWLNNYTNTTQSAADNIRALGKSLGAVVGAAEVLWEIKDPGVTSFQVGSTALGALAGLAVASAFVTAPILVTVGLGVGAGVIAKLFWEKYIAPEILNITQESSSLFWDDFGRFVDTINDTVSTWWTAAQTWVAPRRDPLVFDLDADGLETTALNTTNPILFDHDADDVKTATGWIKPDDGFLVLDRNGNGVIDNGRELFGDATLIPDGLGGQRNALDGFEALSAQDTNLDGVVNNQDANFANLRIWQDLNQNGSSETTELFTLTQKNIASINLAKTENNTLLGNGNVIADLGTYTKTDGTTGTLGETAQLGDVDLRENTFYSSFANPITLTPEAQALPNMQGSGQVRDLREAVSLSPSLTTALTSFTQATTRSDQRNGLDPILQAWSNTSTMLTTATGAYAGHPLTITFEGVTAGSAAYNAWLDKLSLLERFNGRTFRVVPTGTAPVTVSFSSGQMTLLDQSYNALKESAYSALFLQTRGKPYLDAIGLNTDAAGKCSPQRRKGRKEKEVWAGELKRAA